MFFTSTILFVDFIYCMFRFFTCYSLLFLHTSYFQGSVHSKCMFIQKVFPSRDVIMAACIYAANGNCCSVWFDEAIRAQQWFIWSMKYDRPMLYQSISANHEYYRAHFNRFFKQFKLGWKCALYKFDNRSSDHKIIYTCLISAALVSFVNFCHDLFFWIRIKAKWNFHRIGFVT